MTLPISPVHLIAAQEALPLGALAVETRSGRTELNHLAAQLLGPAPSPQATHFDELFGSGALAHLRSAPGPGPHLLRAHHPEALDVVVDLRRGPPDAVMACTVQPWPHGADDADAESQNRLAHVVSHDLREPHRMIDSFLELLVRDVEAPLTPRGERDLHFLRDATHRLGAQLEALTLYARLETRGRAFTGVDLRAIIDEAERRTGHRDQVAMEVHRPATKTMVLGDSGQLASALHSLLDNAIKFRHTESPSTCLDVVTRDGRVIVSVVDNGIGVPEGDHERMFRMLQQRHPRGTYPGMGMGLPLARRIARRHGGDCWLTARPDDRGTLAQLSLQPAFGHDG